MIGTGSPAVSSMVSMSKWDQAGILIRFVAGFCLLIAASLYCKYAS